MNEQTGENIQAMSQQRSKKKEILKQASVYSIGTQLTQMITLVSAILSRRFLGPTQTGIWSTLQILVDYSKYATMGTLDAAAREIPLLQGKGEIGKAETIKNVAFTFVLTSGAAIAAGVLLTASLLRHKFSAEVTYGLYFVAAVIFLQRINNLLVALLRCFKKFEIEAVFMIASSIVNGVLVACLTYRFKIYGFIWALIFSYLFNILFLLKRYPYGFRWNWNREQLKPLLTYGLPLMGLGVTAMLVKNIDKIMIAKLMGFKELGLYSIALMACSYLSNFSISVAIVLVPHFQERFGRQQDPRDLEVYLRKASKAYALTLPFMIGMAWLFGPPAVSLVLPKFTAGIPAMKILTLSLFFVALIQPFHDFLITIKKHFLLFPILAASALIAAGADWAVIRAGWGINGVAFATVAAYAFNFVLVYFTAAWFFRASPNVLPHFAKMVGVFVYFAGVLGVLQHPFFHDASRPWLSIGAAVALYGLAYGPLFAVLNREFSLLPLLWDRLTRKRETAS
jgi:O-antigen/teichoic acid export membrane protein